MTKRPRAIDARVATLAWDRVVNELDAFGAALSGSLRSAAKCEQLAHLYTLTNRFRSGVVMERHGFGRGEYR